MALVAPILTQANSARGMLSTDVRAGMLAGIQRLSLKRERLKAHEQLHARRVSSGPVREHSATRATATRLAEVTHAIVAEVVLEERPCVELVVVGHAVALLRARARARSFDALRTSAHGREQHVVVMPRSGTR